MTEQFVKRDINARSTWAYPDIPRGVTVVRKESVTEKEIYAIYKECIEIQRDAYIRAINQKLEEISNIES